MAVFCFLSNAGETVTRCRSYLNELIESRVDGSQTAKVTTLKIRSGVSLFDDSGSGSTLNGRKFFEYAPKKLHCCTSFLLYYFVPAIRFKVLSTPKGKE